MLRPLDPASPSLAVSKITLVPTLASSEKATARLASGNTGALSFTSNTRSLTSIGYVGWLLNTTRSKRSLASDSLSITTAVLMAPDTGSNVNSAGGSLKRYVKLSLVGMWPTSVPTGFPSSSSRSTRVSGCLDCMGTSGPRSEPRRSADSAASAPSHSGRRSNIRSRGNDIVHGGRRRERGGLPSSSTLLPVEDFMMLVVAVSRGRQASSSGLLGGEPGSC